MKDAKTYYVDVTIYIAGLFSHIYCFYFILLRCTGTTYDVGSRRIDKLRRKTSLADTRKNKSHIQHAY